MSWLEYLLSKAVSTAAEWHRGQIDKTGFPYCDHLDRVSVYAQETASKYGYSSEDGLKCAIVGLLHDIIEDTEMTEDGLKILGFPDAITASVMALTRKDGESYGEFVKRASEDKYGRIVKYADLKDHLDISRFRKLEKDDIDRLNKYLKWYHYLEEIVLDKLYDEA